MHKTEDEYSNYFDIDVSRTNHTSIKPVASHSFLVQNKEKSNGECAATEYISSEEPDVYNFYPDSSMASTSMSKPHHPSSNRSRIHNQSQIRSISDHPNFSAMNKMKNDKVTNRRKKKQRYSVTSLSVSTISVYSAFAPNSKSDAIPPKRSTCQLLLNSSIMFGREFCYAVEGSLTTPILLSIGLPLHLYSMVWTISPILGFILQPILGSLSDRCTCRWGKRRPFILGLAILLLIGMALFLNGEQLVTIFLPQAVGRSILSNNRKTLTAIIITVIGVVLFDFSADFIEGPIRAYAMDVCDEGDIKRSLLFQAIFSGAGGAFGYASGGIAWTRDTPLLRLFPTDRQVVYCASSLIFIICCLFNFTSISEKQFKSNLKQNKFEPKEDETQSKQNHSYQNIDSSSNHIFPRQNENASGSAKTNEPRKCHQFFLEREDNVFNSLKEKENSDIIYKDHSNVNQKLPNAFGFKNKNKKKRKKRVYKVNKRTKPKNNKINDSHNLKNIKRKKLLRDNKAQLYGTFLPNQTLFTHNHSQCNKSQSSFVPSKTKKWERIHHTRNVTRQVCDAEYESNLPLLHRRKSYESDSDSTSSLSTSFENVLEKFLPYASVDPAFNHLPFQKINHENKENTNGDAFTRENTSSKRKIYPDKITENNFYDVIKKKNQDFFVDSEQDEHETPNPIEQNQEKKNLLASIKTMPRELKMLCICHLIGWIAFLSVALFFTDFVGQVVMNGDPRASSSFRQNKLYNRGVEIGSWGLTINAAISCFYCIFLKVLIRKLGFRCMYVCGYLFFAIGGLVIAIFPSVVIVLSFSSTIGIMSATLNTLPYMLVAQYHESYKNREGCDVINRGVGVDCALVTCMIQLAQIITGLGIGGLVNVFGTVTVTIAVSSVFGFIGSLWALLFVQY